MVCGGLKINEIRRVWGWRVTGVFRFDYVNKVECWSRIHEHTISLRFLGIILRVLRHQVDEKSEHSARLWWPIRAYYVYLPTIQARGPRAIQSDFLEFLKLYFNSRKGAAFMKKVMFQTLQKKNYLCSRSPGWKETPDEDRLIYGVHQCIQAVLCRPPHCIGYKFTSLTKSTQKSLCWNIYYSSK